VLKGSPRICVQCKGFRKLCGLPRCPLVYSSIYRSKAVSLISKGSLEGSTPPSLLVGEAGYPKVRLYLGIPPSVRGDEAAFYDKPAMWFGKLGLEDVVSLRSAVVFTVTNRFSVHDIPRLSKIELLLAAVSEKPVDAEAEIDKVLRAYVLPDPVTPPMGPSVLARNVRVVGNPYLHRSLEKAINDELRAAEAIHMLYMDGVDFYTIVRALSLGLLGLERNRKAVPTRWSITAVDQQIGNQLLSSLRTAPTISEVLVFWGEYMYNRYVVVLSPGPYRGFWVEVWHPASVFNPGGETEVFAVEEHPMGRYTAMDGGYIAARTSVAEYLYKLRRQARVAILREILPQYIYPVGSWQIRLTVKHALERGPVLRNPSPSELSNYIASMMRVPKRVVEQVLEFVYGPKQKRLDEFFSR